MANTYQPFGKPTNSDYGKPRGAGKTHWGQDFTAANGTPIPSATAGTVIFSGYNPSGGLGWCVVVKDANGVGHVYAHMGFAQENNNPNSPPDGMPAVGESIRVGDSLGPVGNTGHVIPAPTDEKPYLGTHLHIATVNAEAIPAIEAQGKAIGTGGSGSLGVQLNGSTTLNPDEYLQNNPDLLNPAPVTLPGTPDSAPPSNHSENTTGVVGDSQTGHWEDTTEYDAFGNVTVPGERIWVSDEPSTTPPSTPPARADENYSHEGRNKPSVTTAGPSADGASNSGDVSSPTPPVTATPPTPPTPPPPHPTGTLRPLQPHQLPQQPRRQPHHCAAGCTG